MTAPTISEYLKFVNLQMAAESLFGFKAVPNSQSLTPGATRTATTPLTAEELTDGNLHASKFTAPQAAEFATQWQLVEQISNTKTGFSGTLFRCKITDPSKGLVEGQLVMSLRSTEFLDDAARDNQATNTLEIKEKGWAFGQIDDMEIWYKHLKESGLLPAGQQISVTGYSLGGHLATAFNLLHKSEVTEVVTFNGAGIGKIGTADGSLASTQSELQRMVARFRELRSQAEGAGLDVLLQSALGKTTYAELKTKLIETKGVPDQSLVNLLNTRMSSQANAADLPNTDIKGDYLLLWQALDRALVR